jgi:hypothetical protein
MKTRKIEKLRKKIVGILKKNDDRDFSHQWTSTLNQSFNQSFNQSIKSIYLSIYQSINLSINQSIDPQRCDDDRYFPRQEVENPTINR